MTNRLKEFNGLPEIGKEAILAQSERFREIQDKEKEILAPMYGGGKGHFVLFIAEDIAVIENYVNPKFKDARFTVSIFTGGRWMNKHEYYSSPEIAYMGGLSLKYEGLNGRFEKYAAMMLGLGDSEK